MNEHLGQPSELVDYFGTLKLHGNRLSYVVCSPWTVDEGEGVGGEGVIMKERWAYLEVGWVQSP